VSFALFTSLSVAALAAVPSSGTIGPRDPRITWQNTAIGTGAADPATTIEGVNSDTYTLTVTGLPTEWQGKAIRISLDWGVNLNDYDLYVYKDTATGTALTSSGGGAPETNEAVIIEPAKSGIGVYVIKTIYFANTPGVDQPHGTVEVLREAHPFYMNGGMTFSPNTPDYAPANNTDAEPSSRTDGQGNHYISGIRGFPAGCDLWYYDLRPNSPTYDPYMRNPQYRGLIDGLTGRSDVEAGGDGGGDIDLAVSRDPQPPNNVPTLAYASLIAANISTGNSKDKGQSFTRNPIGNSNGGPSVDDRQWIEFYGNTEVYMLYRTFGGAVSQIQKSTDGGVTYGPTRTVGLIGQVGAITIDQNDGTVYVSGSTGRVGVGLRNAVAGEPLTYQSYQACTDPNGVAHLFFVIKCASNGTVYGAYSNDKDVFLIYSKDHAQTWSAPMRVNDGPESNISVFPAIEVSPTDPDRVGVGWYGTSNAVNNTDANWNVFYADVRFATSRFPIVRQAQVSDHIIHAGDISEQGFNGTANRNLLDYFQISYDPVGAVVIGYADDHNDFYGNCYSTRQISGDSIKGGKLKKPVEGAQLPPKPTQLSPDGAQVIDHEADVSDALMFRAPTQDPIDIRTIRYSSETSSTGEKIIVATTKVSTMNALMPQTSWRMHFTVNAPNATLNESKLYTNASDDRGDRFWVRATYTGTGTNTYEFGSMSRDVKGLPVYTKLGVADGGSVDPTENSITVKISASKLAPYITHGPAIGAGTILTGFKGFSYTTTNANARNDYTFGGTQYTIP
jgi:hypothetical protein